jgi:hypothetical protein
MHLPVGLGASLPQALQKQVSVGDAAKDGFLVIAAVHDMVDSPFELQSEFACHAPEHRA